jgi:hypothetical protein
MRTKIEIRRTVPSGKRCERPEVRTAAAGALGGVLLGALGAYFLDPDRGRQRRHLARDRSTAALRRGARHAARRTRVQASLALGHARGAVHRFGRAPAQEVDDATLAHKVESIVFRDTRVPKGRISINAEHGAVFLRGEIDSQDLIDDLGRAVKAVAGVHAVENLLHLPGTAAPHPDGGVLLRERREG